jgi:hypothetical protein
MNELPFRQIHLDFHTSEQIPDVGSEFSAEAFAATLHQAHVESINIFAKCHHGMSYYPSKVGPMHPSLKFDLLGEMIEALHKRQIKCPVYMSVVWDEYAASTHPEWLQLDSSGKVVGREPYSSGGAGEERWRYLCLNTGYMDYLSAQVQEILDGYDADGLWFDIVMYSEDGCSCGNCIRSMTAKGLDPTNRTDRQTHAYQVMRGAMARLHKQVKDCKPDALVFFNCRQTIDADPERSFRRELPYVTHIEIESLPSGQWGYNHFPLFVRYNQIFGKEIVGMNGKFHKSWGDFGGYKNKAALEFECFNMLASGAKVCVGDQLHPRGKLDPASYALIGEVFAQIEKKEPWCRQARPVAQIGVMAVNDGGYGRACRPAVDTLEAAMQMLLEDRQQFQIIDSEEDLSRFDLIVFPDKVRFDAEMERKVRDYLRQGGRCLLSGESGLRADADAFAIDLGVKYGGDSEYTTTYLRISDAVRHGLLAADYAMYERGKRIEAAEAQVLARVVHPYFERAWNHFMSHQQAAPDRESGEAAIVRKGNVIYFSHPIFRAYKKHGSLIYKRLVSACIDLLLEGGKIVQSPNLPSTARVTVFDQPGERRRVVHVLHYPIERRADIDIIEDVIPLYDVRLKVRCAVPPKRVYLAPERREIAFRCQDGFAEFTVPEVKGHQMIALEQ